MGTSRMSRNVIYEKMGKPQLSSISPLQTVGGIVKRQIINPIKNTGLYKAMEKQNNEVIAGMKYGARP